VAPLSRIFIIFLRSPAIVVYLLYKTRSGLRIARRDQNRAMAGAAASHQE
jgi:branched-subunit amino acid ABC-type transport system permease component